MKELQSPTPHGELVERLRDLAERMPLPYEEDRSYSINEQERLMNDIDAVNSAVSALSETAPLGMSQFASKADYEAAVSAIETPRKTEYRSVHVAGAAVKTISIPLENARLIRSACLPHNPNKCRNWDAELLAAVRHFIATVESLNGK